VGAETPTPDYFCCPASLLRQVAGIKRQPIPHQRICWLELSLLV